MYYPNVRTKVLQLGKVYSGVRRFFSIKPPVDNTDPGVDLDVYMLGTNNAGYLATFNQSIGSTGEAPAALAVAQADVAANAGTAKTVQVPTSGRIVGVSFRVTAAGGVGAAIKLTRGGVDVTPVVSVAAGVVGDVINFPISNNSFPAGGAVFNSAVTAGATPLSGTWTIYYMFGQEI